MVKNYYYGFWVPALRVAMADDSHLFSCYNYSMVIEQTVEIPVNHRLIIDVPSEVPAGKVILSFTPVADQRSGAPARVAPVGAKRMTEAEEMELVNCNAEYLNKEAMDVLSYQDLDALWENHERWDPSEIARNKTVVPFNWEDIIKE